MHEQQGIQPADQVVVVEVADGGPVRVDRVVLVSALAALPGARWVLCWPTGTDRGGAAAVLFAAAGTVDPSTAVGTLRPVVDAMKRVEEGTVVQTIDRATLHRVIAPLIVDTQTARRALDSSTAANVAPLDGLPDNGRILPLP